MTRPAPTVTVPRTDLERVRDLLMERIYGSPARSPAHNARLEVEDILAAAPAAPQAAGVGEYLNPGDLFWGVCRASHIATNAIAVLRSDPEKIGLVIDALDGLKEEMDSVLNDPSSALRAPPREPEGGAVILKGVGKIDGDGWKDTTRQGEVVFVWNTEKPSPYAPGQYPRIGNEGWSASTSQYDFTPATAQEVRDLFAALATREDAPEEDGARRKLIGLIEQWDGESEYDAEDVAALADDILHAFNGPPVVSEEAPAEAGEELVSALDAFMPSAEVAFLWSKETPPADEVQRYRERYWAVKEALLRLRAQPPAREDAQPVTKKHLPECWGRTSYSDEMAHCYCKKDMGEADDLLPCPFCGGSAEIIHLDEGENAGGSCVNCTACQASGNVEFERKENFVSNWNRRTHPTPDALRVAVEALEAMRGLFDEKGALLAPYRNRDQAVAQCDLALAALQAEQKGGA